MTTPDHEGTPEATGPVIRDKRRIDPVTGELRQPAQAPAADAADAVDAVDAAGGRDVGGVPQEPGQAQTAGDSRATELEQQLGERTADLQRLKAEFDNYRRRVERDRQLVADVALANVLANLLPVLDDIGRAREHGELEGGFKSVAESLEAITGKLGLTPFGESGEPFDPTVHEAMTHTVAGEGEGPSVAQVYQPGYRLGERILRPARVGVVEPETVVPADGEGGAPADGADVVPEG